MPFGKPKEPKAPKEKKVKKPKPAKKEKPPKKPKPPKKARPTKKPRKGQPPAEGEELEQGQEGQEQEQVKKKKPIILLLIPIVLIAAAAVAVFVFVLPHLRGGGEDDPAVVETEEPLPPELPEELMVGEVAVPGMVLEADESGAQAVLAKTVTYTYTNLNDAGAAAETYMDQLRQAEPGFSIVDEDLVRTADKPDFTAAEGTLLMARNLPKPESEAAESPAPSDEADGESPAPEDRSPSPEESGEVESPSPEESAEPAEETPNMALTVRITWSQGQCVVVADEVEGEVTTPPAESGPGGMSPSVGIREAENQLMSMSPAQLGLEGESMDRYEVIAQNGVETVDGMNCIRVDVYNSSTGSNPYQFKGTYLMTLNGAHLYRMDPVTNQLQELEFSLNP